MGVINKVLEGFGPVKRLVPVGVKRAAKQALLEQTLRRAVRKVAASRRIFFFVMPSPEGPRPKQHRDPGLSRS